MLELLTKQYARLKKTTVIARKVYDDRITFVLESGHKLNMSAEELQKEIDAMESARQVSEPFAYIEEAVKEETAKEKRERLKAEAKAKKEAKKKGDS